jgi:hypothetical protein
MQVGYTHIPTLPFTTPTATIVFDVQGLSTVFSEVIPQIVNTIPEHEEVASYNWLKHLISIAWNAVAQRKGIINRVAIQGDGESVDITATYVSIQKFIWTEVELLLGSKYYSSLLRNESDFESTRNRIHMLLRVLKGCNQQLAGNAPSADDVVARATVTAMWLSAMFNTPGNPLASVTEADRVLVA